MRISVVIPCYNAGSWIGDALRSVAGQKYQPDEVIVVDDGSTDNSVEWIKSCGVPLRLLHTTRANGAGARNAGIKAAKGDWIAFLDADDVWYPNHLERIVELVSGTGDIAFINHYDSMCGGADRSRDSVPYPWPLKVPTTGLTHGAFIEYFSRCQWFAGMSGMAVNAGVLREVSGFDEAQIRRHDIELWLRVIRGRTWSYDTVVSSAYRVDTAGSISRKIASREYYFLKAMLKNQDGYRGTSMGRLMRVLSRRAMSGALTDGDAADRQRAIGAAWLYLRGVNKIIFSVARVFPWMFRWLNRVRRAVVLRKVDPS
ncbi:MAG: glycosyltransferase family 2 protein [Gammaproteobacteria bacterium]